MKNTLRPPRANPFTPLLLLFALLIASHAANAVPLADATAPQLRQQLYDTCMNSITATDIIRPPQRPAFCTCAADQSAGILKRTGLPNSDITSEADRDWVDVAAAHALLVCAQPLRLDKYRLSVGQSCWDPHDPNAAPMSDPPGPNAVPLPLATEQRRLRCNCREQYFTAHADPSLFIEMVEPDKLDQHIKMLVAQATASCAGAIPPPPPAPAVEANHEGYTVPGFIDMRQCLPSYPRAAMLADQQGRVTLKIDIDQYGNYLQSAVLESSGHFALDHATMQAMSGCAYRPAVRDGKPVAASLRAIYVWRLGN